MSPSLIADYQMNSADNQNVGELRATYFEANGFGEDGGYGKRWVHLEFGPFRVPLYNSAARRKAVPIHDLHHLVTGYETTPKGEAEIASWEIAAGTHDKWFALLINLPALAYGLVLWPQAVIKAWRYGASVKGLYAADFQAEWLNLNLGQLRRIALQPKPTNLVTLRLVGFAVLAFSTTLLPILWLLSFLL